MLRGVFIGINRYASPVSRLSCATDDALALSTLFADSFGGRSRTLRDGAATRAAIIDALGSLSEAAPDDFVVVTFSGHGTEDHALVPVDVDPQDLSMSCIALDEVAGLLDAVPARNLLVILDCCFSGGFGGARVFAPHSSRAPMEDRTSVEALARGTGRVVITASGAGEPAFETLALGHGLFTHHLLRGLQGMDGIASGSRLGLLQLFDYVSTRVLDSARQFNEVQTPTLYGSVEGAPTLSVLTPGALYTEAFPERSRQPASESWTSLAPYGLPAEAIAAWAAAMPGLNALQLEAINDFGVLDDRSLLVVAPTGSGKTLIGELAALRAASHGGRAVMLLPLRALVNDKFEAMRAVYGDRVEVIRATGEFGDQVGALMAGQFDIALLTYEKFLNVALGSPYVMRAVSTVVVDEVQSIADPTRGAALEFLITLLRSGHGRGQSPQVIALSAVVGDTQGLERWLGGSLLRSDLRPIPLSESVLDSTGTLQTKLPTGEVRSEHGFIVPRYGPGSQTSKPFIIPLVQRLVQDGKKVIVFRATRGDTVGTANYLAAALQLPPATDVVERLPDHDLSTSSTALRRTVSNGVAFHNSDLDPEERAVLETAFRDPGSPLRVLVATTTVAMGVNTPAESVVIAGLTHPGRPPAPYTVAEYKNMAGRAGRPGHADQGEAFIIATGDPGPTEAWNRYVQGQPEPIASHFVSPQTDPQTLALRALVALGSSVPEEALIALLENSFAIWLRSEQGLPGWDSNLLRRDLDALTAAQLVDREPDGRLTVTELGRYAGESGLEVRSIVQISSALRFAPPHLTSADLITLAQVTDELDQINLPTHRTSRQEQARWPNFLRMYGVPDGLLQALHVGGGVPVARAKRAAACLLYISSGSLSAIEAQLTQHLRENSIAGPLRQVASRTRDVIDTVHRVAAFRGHGTDESSEQLPLQLELGVPSECLGLAQQLGARLTRGQYLSLAGIGCTTNTAVLACDPMTLRTALGSAAAERLVRELEELDAASASGP